MNCSKIFLSLLLGVLIFLHGGAISANTCNNTLLHKRPEPPAKFNAVAIRGQAFLSWDACESVLAYTVKRSLTPGGPYSIVQHNSSNYYLTTGIADTITYYYTVTALNAGGEINTAIGITAQPANELKIACLGDSITFGYGLSNPSVTSYPAQLGTLLEGDYTVENFGSSGRTLLFNGDSPYVNGIKYANALNSNPDVVVVLLGTNDSKPINWNPYGAQYPTDYETMIDELKNIPSNPKIFIALPPKAFSGAYDISENNLANGVRPDVVAVANAKGVSVIDLFDATKNSPANFPDGIHPGGEGSLQIAQKVKELILTPQQNVTASQNTLTAPVAYGYQWFKNGVKIQGATLQFYQATAIGNYTVLLKLNEDNEDRVISNPLAITTLVSPGFIVNTPDFLVYPSPAKLVLTVESPSLQNINEVKIYNTIGQLVYFENNITKPKTAITVSNLSVGTYTIMIGNNTIKNIAIAN